MPCHATTCLEKIKNFSTIPFLYLQFSSHIPSGFLPETFRTQWRMEGLLGPHVPIACLPAQLLGTLSLTFACPCLPLPSACSPYTQLLCPCLAAFPLPLQLAWQTCAFLGDMAGQPLPRWRTETWEQTTCLPLPIAYAACQPWTPP